jgi:predicted nucleotidyltransferase
MGDRLPEWDFSAHEPEVLHEIAQRLAPLAPRLVMLFGSRATGVARRDSDYDLLVIMDLPDPVQPRSLPVRRLLRGLGVPFDVLVYTPEEWDAFRAHPLALVHRIAREGKVLLGAA